MAPQPNIHSLTRRLLTLQRTPDEPEIHFRPVGSILGTSLPSEIELKYLDVLSPEQCNRGTCVAIQHLLTNAIPRWRWISQPPQKLQKKLGRTYSYKKAWKRLWKRDIGAEENVLILVERETLASVDAVLERPLSLLDLEERLSRVGEMGGWERSKTRRLKVWKRPVSDDKSRW